MLEILLNKLYVKWYNTDYWQFSQVMFVGTQTSYSYSKWLSFTENPVKFWAGLDEENQKIFINWLIND